MTMHRDKFLVNKTNRRTEFQFYWYYDSTRFGQPFCPSSGVLSRTSTFLHFMRLYPIASDTNSHTVHNTTHRLLRTTATTPSAERHMQQYTTRTPEDGHIDVRNM